MGKKAIKWVVVASTLAGALAGCNEKSPIRVGFAGELTGKQADLGVQGRNGVQLAVDDINARGGVAGRKIQLEVRDDLGTPEGAQAADRELIDAGVVAIIGHMTSEQTLAGLSVTEEAGMVLLSPTASSPDLTRMNDHFIRVNPVISSDAHTLAHLVFEQHGLHRVAVIYDRDNAAYSQTFLDAFTESYVPLGGQVASELSFSSAEEPDFGQLVTTLRASAPEGLLIIASGLDTALIAQHARLDDWQVPLFTTGWAQTEALIQNGGRAVEGIEIVMSFDLNNQSAVFLDFRERYEARFDHLPTFAAVHGYEAIMILAAALEKTGGRDRGLLETLLETRDFTGLMGKLSLDEYGDVLRSPFFLITVQGGQFVTLESLEP